MTDQELEWRFIRAKLIGHGMYLKEELQNAILTQELIDSSRLINSLSFHVNMQESMASGELVIDFYLYGRFQEIGAGRKSIKESSLLEQMVGVRSSRRKKPWYNKTVFGTLNHLIYDLANGFTDETKEMLKAQILRHDKFLASNG
ncbi:MAG: hypothetical protein M0Q51_06405 [Bacteroidales bacterium]|nr:hypothetical protein [Bacteroidales bacterium]